MALSQLHSYSGPQMIEGTFWHGGVGSLDEACFMVLILLVVLIILYFVPGNLKGETYAEEDENSD